MELLLILVQLAAETVVVYELKKEIKRAVFTLVFKITNLYLASLKPLSNFSYVFSV